jgi:hypothetical protein
MPRDLIQINATDAFLSADDAPCWNTGDIAAARHGPVGPRGRMRPMNRLTAAVFTGALALVLAGPSLAQAPDQSSQGPKISPGARSTGTPGPSMAPAPSPPMEGNKLSPGAREAGAPMRAYRPPMRHAAVHHHWHHGHGYAGGDATSEALNRAELARITGH